LVSKKHWLGKRRAFERDTRLAETQLFMQEHLEALMYDISKYILTAYDLFEE
jgi:hypothetical protein